MRFKLHQKSANWDTTHDVVVAEFNDLRKAEICGLALANYHAVSFSAYSIVDTETGREYFIERTRDKAY